LRRLGYLEVRHDLEFHIEAQGLVLAHVQIVEIRLGGRPQVFFLERQIEVLGHQVAGGFLLHHGLEALLGQLPGEFTLAEALDLHIGADLAVDLVIGALHLGQGNFHGQLALQLTQVFDGNVHVLSC
jgi:hypothetical protein